MIDWHPNFFKRVNPSFPTSPNKCIIRYDALGLQNEHVHLMFTFHVYQK